MKDPIYYIHKALYERLTTGGAAISYEVFDNVPDDQSTDFIEIQPVTTSDNSAKSCPGEILVFNFNCWSTALGNKTISEMFTAINESITYTNDTTWNQLTVDNFNVSYTAKESTIVDAIKYTSAFKYQGILTITIWVNPI